MASVVHSDIRPIAAVLRDIVRNVQDIVGSEVRLAKAELREEVIKARSASLLIGTGIVSATFTAFFFLVTIGYALSLVMPAWAAALTVTIGVGIAAALALRAGLKQFRTVHAAPKTMASLKGNLEWAKQQTR
jgi:hypothetical protein